MKISYQCSNCGAHEQTSAGVGIPEGMFYLGYRAHGDVLYCPDCVETWKERNGAEYDEQYKDADGNKKGGFLRTSLITEVDGDCSSDVITVTTLNSVYTLTKA